MVHSPSALLNGNDHASILTPLPLPTAAGLIKLESFHIQGLKPAAALPSFHIELDSYNINININGCPFFMVITTLPQPHLQPRLNQGYSHGGDISYSHRDDLRLVYC
jgi:hypothetical protein